MPRCSVTTRSFCSVRPLGNFTGAEIDTLSETTSPPLPCGSIFVISKLVTMPCVAGSNTTVATFFNAVISRSREAAKN